ncbi:MAG TPA: hypothetical protein VK699_21510 [Terriglobales bacterium]|jgi:hypothetical protein|nr:hypothetical protein [Terriglobales bacterium]
MKMKWIIFVVLVASVAFAQTPAAKAKKASTKPASTSTKKTVKSKKTALASPMAPKTAKPKAVKKAHVEATPAKPEEAAAPEATAAVAAPGRKRDPFVSPVEARLEGMTAACSGGKRCLAVNEIVLRGVVRSQSGMIAVVENAAQKTYFLHENDPIYNGFVEKITPDSVIFKEHYLDNLGHDSQREIVKTVNAPVV